MGEGMGAAVVSALSTIYPKDIQGVILQSGTYSSPWAYNQSPESTTNRILKNMNVESIEDLKSKPLGNILSSVTGTESFSFGMFVDGEILPKHPSKFLDDDFVPFSVMAGYSRDDGYLFALEKMC